MAGDLRIPVPAPIGPEICEHLRVLLKQLPLRARQAFVCFCRLSIRGRAGQFTISGTSPKDANRSPSAGASPQHGLLRALGFERNALCRIVRVCTLVQAEKTPSQTY